MTMHHGDSNLQVTIILIMMIGRISPNIGCAAMHKKTPDLLKVHSGVIDIRTKEWLKSFTSPGPLFTEVSEECHTDAFLLRKYSRNATHDARPTSNPPYDDSNSTAVLGITRHSTVFPTNTAFIVWLCGLVVTSDKPPR